VWTRDFGAESRLRAVATARVDRGLGLYVHIPFCESRCRFCGCNVVVAKDRDRADPYIDQVLRELDLTLAHLPKGHHTVRSLHLGGGTPTFLTTDQLTRLIQGVTRHFDVAPDAEFALEAEPTVTTEEQLETLAALGFNRVSFGVQDLNPQVLQVVSRPRAEGALPGLVDRARSLGFRSVNFDLIYGLPNQTAGRWYQTIQRVIELRPDRLAVYSFAFLPDQRTHQRSLAKYPRPSGIDKIQLFAEAYEALCSAGYQPVGMDHFALPEDELAIAQSEGRLGRNFQGYTTQWDMDILGLGVSAISDVGGAFFQNPPVLRGYEKMIQGDFRPERGWWRTPDDERRRRVIQDLMCNFAADIQPGDVAVLRSELETLTDPAYADLVRVGRDRIELTSLGRIFVRNVAMVFDHYLPAQAGQSFSRTV
jgi:oxygen-independent coproporphyrinogen-3 oxidase